MSDIKRYSVGRSSVVNVDVRENGEFVLYSDHIAAMEALKGVSSQGHEARIKALEENPLANHMALIGEPKTLLMHKPVGVLLQALVDPLKKRIEGLEKALNEHLSQEMAGRTGTGVSAPPQVGATNGDYAIFFDPKASPTGIPFEVALAYVKAGRKVKRRHWNSGAWYFMDRECFMFHPHGSGVYLRDAQITASEVLATNWMVIPEQQ